MADEEFTSLFGQQSDTSIYQDIFAVSGDIELSKATMVNWDLETLESKWGA